MCEIGREDRAGYINLAILGIEMDCSLSTAVKRLVLRREGNEPAKDT